MSGLSSDSYLNDISINLDNNFNDKYNSYTRNYPYFFTENELSYDNVNNNTLTYKINNNNSYENQFIADFSNKVTFYKIT